MENITGSSMGLMRHKLVDLIEQLLELLVGDLVLERRNKVLGFFSGLATE